MALHEAAPASERVVSASDVLIVEDDSPETPRRPPRYPHRVADTTRIIEIARESVGEASLTDFGSEVAQLFADEADDIHPFVVLGKLCERHRLAMSATRMAPDRVLDLLDEGVTVVLDTQDHSGGFDVVTLPIGTRVVRLAHVQDGRATGSHRGAERLLESLGDTPLDVMVLEVRYPLDGLAGGEPGAAGARSKLWKLVKLESSELTALVVYAIFIGALSLVVPISVQALVNTIAFGSALQPLVILGLALFLGLVLSAALQALRAHSVEVLQQRLFVRIVTDFGRRIPKWSAAARDGHDSRELVNRFFDVATLQKSAAELAVDALGLTLQTITGLLLLAFYHPTLLAFDVVLVVALVALVLVPSGRATESAIKESKAKYATAAWLETLAAEPHLFATNAGQLRASAQTSTLARTYVEARQRHWRDLFHQIIGGLSLQVIASVALLLIGGWLVIERQLTLGQLVASELIVAVIGAGFAKLGKQMEKIYDAAAAVDKISQVVDLACDSDSGARLPDGEALRIHIDKLSHGRLGVTVDAIIEPGTNVAVVGNAGSGKSAFVATLYGAVVPAAGAIRFNSVSLSHAHLPTLRSAIGWVDGRLPRAALSIAEHLSIHRPEASTNELWQALEAAGLAHRVRQLPEGLATTVAPRGSPLSTTECMQLSLARAFVQRPRLLLVDRCLDQLAGDVVERVLRGSWTVVYTTYDTELLRAADQLIDLSPVHAAPPAAEPPATPAAATTAESSP